MPHESVLLVHGLGGTRLDMWPVARRMSKLGYRVVNWSYSSLGTRIETIAERLLSQLKQLDHQSDGAPVHVVAHSMGGIILRHALAKPTASMPFDPSEILGRVVMLASPHHGSHAARRLAPYLGWLAPSILQLSDSPDSFVRRLDNPFVKHEIDFAIIEARRDRVIKPGGVLIEGYSDYQVVDGSHGFLTWYQAALEMIENFILHGQLQPRGRAESPTCTSGVTPTS